MLGLNSEAVLVYRRLLTYLQPAHVRVLVGATAAALAYSGITALFPAVIERSVTDAFTSTAKAVGAGWLAAALVVLFAVRGLFDFAIVYGFSWVSRIVVRDLRGQVFSHCLGLPASYYDRNSTGALISKLTFNSEQVAQAIATPVMIILRDGLLILGISFWMIRNHPPLTLVIAVIAAVIAALIAALSRALRRYSAKIQDSMSDVSRVAEQTLQGQRIVKIFLGEARERTQFDAFNDRNFRLNVRLAATSAIGDSLTQLVVAVGLASIILVASFVLAGLSTGDVVATFAAYFTAMGILLTALKRVTNINVALQRGIAAAHSLFALLDEPLERDIGKQPLGRARGAVEFRNVSFGYDADKGDVLRDICLHIPPGTSVALVGRSGSGKSTLASLLPRLYDVEAGAVLLDGIDVRNFKLADLRGQISWVGQDVVLFDDTIANNIAYGELATRSREEIARAADAAYVTEFARELPLGLETPVGERGVLLSGGQRQRVAIARAILKDAPVLILDEATSALDAESERRVQEALRPLMKGRTTLVIAHRLSTIESVDCIVVVHDGAIVEKGSHRELLARGVHYQALYRMQFASGAPLDDASLLVR